MRDERSAVNVPAEIASSTPRTLLLRCVPVGPTEPEVMDRIGRASLALYQELLEFTD